MNHKYTTFIEVKDLNISTVHCGTTASKVVEYIGIVSNLMVKYDQNCTYGTFAVVLYIFAHSQSQSKPSSDCGRL